MNISGILEDYLFENKLQLGVCDAKPFLNAELLIDFDVPFVSKGSKNRIDPSLTLASAKSIIVVAMGYKKHKMYSCDDVMRGKISDSAIGADYHVVLKKHLEAIVNILLNFNNFDYKYFVDNGPLIERELAIKSGVSFYGKNCNAISNSYGSFFNIGYIITSLELDINKKNESTCSNCGACAALCPGKAIGGTFRYNQCVSYLTQKKGILTEDEMRSMGNSIFGCDICQNCCPHNRNIFGDDIYDIECAEPSLALLLTMTNKDFKEKFGNTSAAWRGKSILKRNALIALGNSKDKRAYIILKTFLGDQTYGETAKTALKILQESLCLQ